MTTSSWSALFAAAVLVGGVSVQGQIPVVVHGYLPPTALRLVLEWASLHEAELLEDWQLAREGQPLKKIAPLE
jgi:hypothetical protein